MSPQARRYFAIPQAKEANSANVDTAHKPESFLAICAIFKNEAPYLDEWIRFHRAQGVEHFYLYNNFSDDNFDEVLKLHERYVTVTPWPIPFTEWAQHKAYADCLERNRSEYRWIALIDIDEFIFGVAQPLKSELQAYPDVDQILVNCICYGTSGLDQVPQGSTTKHLTQRGPLWWRRNAQCKSVVNPQAVLGVKSPHEMDMDSTKTYASGDGRTVAARTMRKRGRVMNRIMKLHQRISVWISRQNKLMNILPKSFLLFLDCYGGGFRFLDGVSRIRINHYVIRSAKEYRDKSTRFVTTQFSEKYNAAFFKFHDQNQVHDPVLSDWESGGMYR